MCHSNTWNCFYTGHMDRQNAKHFESSTLVCFSFLLKHWMLWRVLGVCGTHGKCSHAELKLQYLTIPPPLQKKKKNSTHVDCHSAHSLFTTHSFYFISGRTLANQQYPIPFKRPWMPYCLHLAPPIHTHTLFCILCTICSSSWSHVL